MVNKRTSMEEAIYERDQYGFWRQKDARPFTYDASYKDRQSTNREMSYLRIGWLSSLIEGKRLLKMEAVDIGSGTNCFVETLSSCFKTLVPYDLSGNSISKEKLESHPWGMIFLSDVLEHMEDLEYLYELNWEFAFVSFPETPEVREYKELINWRHFRPDEHLWCLQLEGIKIWAEEHGSSVVASSNFEDLIRTPWDPNLPNITSLLIRR